MPFYMMKNKDHLPEDAIEVGRITGAWGIKGSIRVAPYSSDAQALFASTLWYLLGPEAKFGPASSAAHSLRLKQVALPRDFPVIKPVLPQTLTVTSIREQGDAIKADVAEVLDRNLAEAMKGMRIFVSRANFPKLDEDEFYWIDLIGLQVINLQGEALGQVVDLMSNGPQSILQVAYTTEDKHGQSVQGEHLILFVNAYVGKVDFEAGTIQVDWQADY